MYMYTVKFSIPYSYRNNQNKTVYYCQDTFMCMCKSSKVNVDHLILGAAIATAQ